MFRDNELHIILSYNYVYNYCLHKHIHQVSPIICDYSVLIFTASLKPCPAAGTFEMAAKPLGTSANFKPADGDK